MRSGDFESWVNFDAEARFVELYLLLLQKNDAGLSQSVIWTLPRPTSGIAQSEISREHLPEYANEFAFRWNTRQDSDGKRLERFARWIEGKRLTYREVSQPLCVR
jgi:hypothetical protein